MDSTSKIFWLSLRLIQLVVAMLILGLSAYVNTYSHPFQSTPSGPTTPLSFLLLSAFLTPLALIYLIAVPAYRPTSKWNAKRMVAYVEGPMALLWAAGSIAGAVQVTEQMCIGGVCAVAQGVVVLGVFEWMAFMVSFGFSLAGAVRDARSGYRVVESGDPESGMIENKRIGSGKGRDFE